MSEPSAEQLSAWSAAQNASSRTAGTLGQAPLITDVRPLSELGERCAPFDGPVRITRLRVNHLESPEAVAAPIAFSWWVEGSTRRPDAPMPVAVDIRSGGPDGDSWWTSTEAPDTGRPLPYTGPSLPADTRFAWRVRAAGELATGAELVSEWAVFRTALDEPQTELGAWITAGASGEEPDEYGRYPVIGLEHAVDLPPDPVSAHLYVASTGFYCATLNGVRLGDAELTPAIADLQQRLLYDVWSVSTDTLSERITVRLTVAEGYGRDYSIWGWRALEGPRIRALLRVRYADGRTVDIRTGPQWESVRPAERGASLYHGTREDRTTSAQAVADAASGAPARVVDGPSGRLVPRDLPHIRAEAPIEPLRSWALVDGKTVYDFGQNIAGRVRLHGTVSAVTELTVEHSELVDVDGVPDPWTNVDAKARDELIAPAGTFDWEPRFTYHGFRYATVGSVPPEEVRHVQVQAIPIHASVDSPAWFASSDRRLNQLQANLRWSILNNLMSIPTDCPQRNERTPCLMDSAVVEQTGLLNFDLAAGYTSWARRVVGNDRLPDWAGDQVHVAWRLFWDRGDLQFATDAYATLCAWARASFEEGEGVIFPGGFGDWCAPNSTGEYLDSFREPQLVNAALLYRYLRMLERLGREIDPDQADRMRALADACRSGFLRTFARDGGGFGEASASQTGTILALAYGLVPDGDRPRALDWLRRAWRATGSIDTGIYATEQVLPVAREAGVLDRVLRMMLGPDYPGFGYQIDDGATTLWEQWTRKGGMNSHDHAMFAGVGAGFFTTILGIERLTPGGMSLAVRPALDAGIAYAAGIMETARGPFGFGFAVCGDRVTITAYRPPLIAARVALPDGCARRVFDLPAGVSTHVTQMPR